MTVLTLWQTDCFPTNTYPTAKAPVEALEEHRRQPNDYLGITSATTNTRSTCDGTQSSQYKKAPTNYPQHMKGNTMRRTITLTTIISISALIAAALAASWSH